MALLLVPVGLLLLVMGWTGYDLASDHLLDLWAQAASLQLQRAAHQVDMRLKAPKAFINTFAESAGKTGSALVQEMVLDQLRSLDGVVRVDITNPKTDTIETKPDSMPERMGRGSGAVRGMGLFGDMPLRRRGNIQVTPPVFDTQGNHKTVSLVSEFLDENDNAVGSLDVVLEWDYLIGAVESEGLWKSQKAIVSDNLGNILACNLPTDRKLLGGTGDPLEEATLQAMKEKPFGTIIYTEDPLQVSGFHRLKQAPWTMVIIAPGKEILAPIVSFRNYYIAGAIAEFFIILLLIRIVTARTVGSIKEVSDAARMVSRGDYSLQLPIKSRDEMGTLIRDFNTMVVQLEERARLKTSINLAMEVQQNLLPQKAIQFQGLDIAGISVYCDETGGDYYDFLQFEALGKNSIAIAVGDVSGHGISSALFMTTARAFIRSRTSRGGGPARIIEDINRLLCTDTQQSGSFMTLFFLVIDTGKNTLTWVRAGHDPALLYDPATSFFEELDGKGLALGVRCQWDYEENQSSQWGPGRMIFLGTDGIWEARNSQGEQFGKERFKESIRKYARLSSENILDMVLADLAAFRQGALIEDDITLVVVKADARLV
ncbi:MAG: SpoIIE family protein phosphatase [Desulfatibacillum sp.]|nr:SpoIIE family protein phosphatase [Desulfatibacillum sp.]